MGRVFDMHAPGQLTGIMMTFAQLTGASGPYVTGYLHDALRSCVLVFMIVGVSMMVGAGLKLRFLVVPGEAR
jgi:cyanate permease